MTDKESESKILSRGRSVGSLLSQREFKLKICTAWYQNSPACYEDLKQVPFYAEDFRNLFGWLKFVKNKFIHENGQVSRVNSYLHQEAAQTFAQNLAQKICAQRDTTHLLPEPYSLSQPFCNAATLPPANVLESLYENIIGLEALPSETTWFAQSFWKPSELDVTAGEAHLTTIIYGLTYNPYFILAR